MSDGLAPEYEVTVQRDYLEKQIARGWKLMQYYIESGQRNSPLAEAVRHQLGKYEAQLNELRKDDIVSDSHNYIKGE